MRISDWSSDGCSSDLTPGRHDARPQPPRAIAPDRRDPGVHSGQPRRHGHRRRTPTFHAQGAAMSESHHAVFGHPITHSLSPRIHARFSRQTGIALRFEAIDATPDTFATALEAFTAGGGDGASVTLPLKEAALALCTGVSERARRAGAVNVLVRKGDQWHGDNTDGSGLVRDLAARQGVDRKSTRLNSSH